MMGIFRPLQPSLAHTFTGNSFELDHTHLCIASSRKLYTSCQLLVFLSAAFHVGLAFVTYFGRRSLSRYPHPGLIIQNSSDMKAAGSNLHSNYTHKKVASFHDTAGISPSSGQNDDFTLEMASYLEQVPRDILVNIAYLCATPSIADLCNLILANSSIYQSLSIRTCPHLYARIFRSKFDVGCRRVRACRTDSALAGELLHRCFALRRVRKRAFSGKFLSWDLRTILQMLIEGGEKNDEHLYAVGFSEYILDLVQQRSEIHFDGLHHTNRNDCDALIVWLLCFTLSRSRINEIGEHTQQTILDFLRPFTLPTFAIPVNTEPPCFCDPSSDRFVPDYNEASSPSSDEDPCQVKDEYRVWRLTCPYPSCPAIILTFSLIEARPFSLPQRLREGPSNQPQGPTLQDFRDVLNEQHMTLLFADVKRSAPTAFWDALDLEFRLMLRDQSISAGAFRYNPGQLAGLWEGRYAVASLPAEGEDALDFATPRDFPAGKFMQCMFDEYLCFGPNDPIPPVDLEDWETDPNFIARSENGLYCCSKEYRYERYTGHSVNSWSEDEVSEQLLDIVILGETLESHERAWGGYRFAGRIRRDGSVTFKRTAKEATDGVWTFDGRIHYGAAMVGRWRSGTPSDGWGVHGIFSMRRRDGF